MADMSPATLTREQAQDIVSAGEKQTLYNAVVDSSFRYAGLGSRSELYRTVLGGIDRFHMNALPLNHNLVGITLFTRPNLNLATSSIRADPVLSTLSTLDPISIPFALRCYLDTTFAQWHTTETGLATKCPFINMAHPFISPITNTLQNISGFPDFSLNTETISPGFFGEDFTLARGADMGRGTHDINITVRDISGGFMFALFYIWTRWIALNTLGVVRRYPVDINDRIMSYTCSIYRFVVDTSRESITYWAKLTGCFPTSVPTGAILNMNDRESYITGTETLSIPFKCNHFEAMNPMIFSDFNRIVGMYSPDIRDLNKYTVTTIAPEHNFVGVPYIETEEGSLGLNRLTFRAVADELVDPTQKAIDTLMSTIAQRKAEIAARSNELLATGGFQV